MKIYPSRLVGEITVPTSKSLVHRHMICQALAGVYETIDEGEDIRRTARALCDLRDGVSVIDCGMSGSTLRFLLPVAAALGRVGVTFTGEQRLLMRPVRGNIPAERTDLGWRVTGPLIAGAYYPDGSVTSQVISGLLLSLPLLDHASDIMLSDEVVSRPYLDMTRAELYRHGVVIQQEKNRYHIPAPQLFKTASAPIEGDWSIYYPRWCKTPRNYYSTRRKK